MTAKDYPQMARDINAVGLDNLRRHIRKFHPTAVANMERNIAMIKYCVRNGPNETGHLFNLTGGVVRETMERYWKYAKEAKREAERLREEA